MGEPVIHSLSPEQRAAAIDGASRQPEHDTRITARAPEDAATDRRMHGEVGFTVGTNGTRGVFGSTMLPLGDNGAVALSFSTGRSNFGGYGMGGYDDYGFGGTGLYGPGRSMTGRGLWGPDYWPR